MIATETDVVTTGLVGLDRALGGGLRRGSLVTVAGPTSSGKSSLMRRIVEGAASTGGRVLAISLEAGAADLGRRLVASAARVEARRLAGAGPALSLAERVRVASARRRLVGVRLAEDGAIDGGQLDAIVGLAERMAGDGKIDILVVDYVQLVRHGDRRLDSDRLAGAETACAALRDLARRFGIVVVAVRQLDRGDRYPPGRRHADQVVELVPLGAWRSDRPAEVVGVRCWHRGEVDPVRCRLRFTKECTRFNDIT